MLATCAPAEQDEGIQGKWGAMSTNASMIDHQDSHRGVPQTPERRSAPWRWRIPGATLVMGGLLSAIGAYLRWWGPLRLTRVAGRENDDASPLHRGWTFHQHPGSAELFSGGQIVVAVGLLMMLLVPWRSAAAKVIAWPTLVAGAIATAFLPALWLGWVTAGRPEATFPGWSPSLPAWIEAVGQVSLTVWAWGPGAVLLAGAAVLTARTRSVSPPHLVLLPVSICLFVASFVVEHMLTMLLFVSDSHDDPIGVGVLGGIVTAVAGALLWSSADNDGLLPSRTAGAVIRRGRRWLVGGVVLAVGGALMFTVARLVPPASIGDLDATARWMSSGAALVAPLGLLVLAAGPWRGVRRPIAAVLCTFGVLAPLVGAAILILGITIGEPGPESVFGTDVADHLAHALVAPVWGTGHLFVPFAVLLLWEWWAPIRHRIAACVVLLVSLGAGFASEIYEDVFLLDTAMDTPDALVARSMLLAVSTLAVGLTWCVAALLPIDKVPRLHSGAATEVDDHDQNDGDAPRS